MKTTNEIIPTDLFHPGISIAEEIEYRNLSKKEVAQKMGIAPTVLSEIISGKRNITAMTAIKLEAVLGIDALYFMNLQTHYDYYSLKKELEKKNVRRKKAA